MGMRLDVSPLVQVQVSVMKRSQGTMNVDIEVKTDVLSGREGGNG